MTSHAANMTNSTAPAVSEAGLEASVMQWTGAVVDALPAIVAGLVVFILAYLGASFARAGAKRAVTKSTKDERAGSAWGILVQYAVILLGLVAALAVAGVDLAALMVAVGAAAFGVAFAMQDIIANLMSGLLILLQRPFGVGDGVEVAGGVGGKVEDVRIRSTIIRSFDGLRIEVPNKSVLSNPITVFTFHESRRFDVAVGIGYDDDVAGATQVIRGSLAGVDGVLQEPEPEIMVDGLGGSSVDLKVRFWVQNKGARNVFAIRGDATRAVKEALQREGYDIPYPIRTIFMHHENGGNGASPDGAEPAVSEPTR